LGYGDVELPDSATEDDGEEKKFRTYTRREYENVSLIRYVNQKICQANLRIFSK